MPTHDSITAKKKLLVYNDRRRPPQLTTSSSSSRSSRMLLTIFYLFLLTVLFFLCSRHLLLRSSSSLSIHINANTNNNKSAPSIKEEITLAATKLSNNTTSTSITSSTTIIPPLKDLIDSKGKVISDISWMLDFAIIGFPKSGTSFLKNYLNQTDETYVYHVEFCIKKKSDLIRFVEVYYGLHLQFQQQQQQQQQASSTTQQQQQKKILFGLKCPGVLYRTHDLQFYQHYFPNTKFIIGLRHPVLWFESFYNYQINRNVSMPELTTSSSSLLLVGKCEHHEKVCTDRGRFHAALARLRKTELVEREEVDLLFGTRYEEGSNYNSSSSYNNNNSSHHSRKERFLSSSKSHKQQQQQQEFPNQLLLYEVQQLHQTNTTIPQQVSETLRNYLGIQQELPPIRSYKNVKPRAIDICDDEHASVRRLLVNHGTDAAIWIQKYLMKSPSVEVASAESFVRLLDGWSVDPCANNA